MIHSKTCLIWSRIHQNSEIYSVLKKCFLPPSSQIPGFLTLDELASDFWKNMVEDMDARQNAVWPHVQRWDEVGSGHGVQVRLGEVDEFEISGSLVFPKIYLSPFQTYCHYLKIMGILYFRHFWHFSRVFDYRSLKAFLRNLSEVWKVSWINHSGFVFAYA